MPEVVRIFGHPVGHSISPAIHNAAFAALGIDAVYEAVDVPPAELGQAIAELRAQRLLGANCTIPHKLAVLDLVDERTEETRLIGAANTLFWRDEALVADNTDAGGLEQVIRAEWPDLAGQADSGGRRAVILGSGGAARAAAVALARLGCSVTVLARREVPAESVAATAASVGVEAVGMGLEYAAAAVAAADLVVNATPLGLKGEALPEPFMRLAPGQAALDLVYGAVATPFVAAARERGAWAADGVGMLVGQAALAFRRWTGREAPFAAMEAAAKAALGRG